MQDAQNDMNIVILDACRNNPLPKTRGADRGLARMSAPSGTFIAYAAAPGQTAQDGQTGANGVFTGELVKAMAEPGIPLEQMYKKVIASVRMDTHGAQQPWSESSIQGDFFFHGLPDASSATGRAAASPAGAGTAELEIAYWNSIKDSKNPGDFRAYLQRYPNGNFATLAAARLKTVILKKPDLPRSEPPEHPSPVKNDRCGALLERAQIGDPLNDDERAYLTTRCQ
jgi:uncharacterized caspase-like protein